MTKQQRFKGTILELAGGLMGWLWLLLIPVSIVLFLGALFFHIGWGYFLVSFVLQILSKIVARSFVAAISTHNSTITDWTPPRD